ncbi:MAG: LLM class flavin-dependent oxidoreductase [Thauera sp.]|nr:LLM class flavin-dependent oxidoreductase [Thauera sp.]
MHTTPLAASGQPVRLSILDLAPITAGSDAGQALRNSRALAQLADGLGYTRYWLAEHHNMPGVASAATAVVIGHLAAATSRIRVGAGGIMLPNHAPLMVAEQFGTLEALFPGRIDLGLGRAPGTDQRTARALRRNLASSEDGFAHDVAELQAWFAPVQPGQTVQAVPGAGLNVPLWILGSSLYGAQLAAEFGLPYAFASHFAPRHLAQALELYRARFKPSAVLNAPYVMVAANAVVADTAELAQHHAASQRLRFAGLARGELGPLPPPQQFVESDWSAAELAFADESLRCSAIGSPEQARQQLIALQRETGADEIIVAGQIYDHQARLHSCLLLAQAWGLTEKT